MTPAASPVPRVEDGHGSQIGMGESGLSQRRGVHVVLDMDGQSQSPSELGGQIQTADTEVDGVVDDPSSIVHAARNPDPDGDRSG